MVGKVKVFVFGMTFTSVGFKCIDVQCEVLVRPPLQLQPVKGNVSPREGNTTRFCCDSTDVFVGSNLYTAH